jgi:uncharacterized protein (DUF433 family)
MNYRERIISNPDIMLGKPTVKGTRITVELLLSKLAEGLTPDEVLKCYPHLKKEDILAAIDYAARVIADEEMIEVSL